MRYLSGRGLADAHARLVRRLREVRQLYGTASPGRQELREGALRPDLVGGLTFALDLSQAFDTVSRQEIIATLPTLTEDPTLVSLVHALHHRSAYRLTAQGEVTTVETTTGIKQGCKLAPSLFSLLTGKLIKELIAVFGEDRVCAFLMGYADDLTVHRTIRSVADVEACHVLIRAVLDSLKDHKLVCNRSKCYILAKFAGRQAASVTRQYTAWTRNEAGERIKLWRIRKTKYFPAFRWVSTIKFLGIKASYGSFEMQTLSFRISEAKQKLHQVRKFVCNRRVASTMSRLRVWQSVVWPTLSFGLAEVGLTLESARALKAWYAFKVRSVLNKPAHMTHMTTGELYDLYSIEDPVVKLERLQENRHASLNVQQTVSPGITCNSAALQQAQDQLNNLRQFRHLPEPDAAGETPVVPCQHCDRTFIRLLRKRLKTVVAQAPKHILPKVASSHHAEELESQCLQCGFWTPDYTKLKSHMRKVHTQLWDTLQDQVAKTCSGFSAHTPKGMKCPFCGLQVYNRNKHCLQCPVTFQIVLEWHSRQPTARSDHVRAEPQQVSIRQAFQGPANRPTPAPPTSGFRILLNKANSCYINSTFMALGHSCQDIPETGIEAVFVEMSASMNHRPLNLYSSFAVRSLARGWRFDGRQHDAAEFYSAIAPDQGPLQPAPWQARVEGLVEGSEVGLTPLLLPVHEASTLQACVDRWSNRGLQYALLQAPQLLPVVLCRWQDGVKNQASITNLRDVILIPVWQEGQNRNLIRYRLSSGVFHIGDQTASGHYRAFWPQPESGIMVSENFVPPSLAGP